ncbi:MAG: hypothetical protein NC911_01340 [Candidatus Omnitrophica bacterium]|nr:hypothetical protein [Candidatus Omnitrophota bacterium]
MKQLGRYLFWGWFLTSSWVFAQNYQQLIRSAEINLRKKEYSGAKEAAHQAREKAQTEEEKQAATLVIAKVLTEMGQKEEAKKEYQKILQSSISTVSQQAEALMGLAKILREERRYESAREYLARIFSLTVDEKIKNKALTDFLFTWSESENLAGLKEAVENLSQRKQADWPNYQVHLFTEAGRILSSYRDWTVRDYKTSRRYYRQILSLPGVSSEVLLNAWLAIAGSYVAEGHLPAARKALSEALHLKELQPLHKATILREMAKTFTGENDYQSAREALFRALQLERLTDGTKGNILAEIANSFYKEGNLEKMAETVAQLLKLSGANDRDKINQLLLLGNLHWEKKDYQAAAQTYGQVLQVRNAGKNDKQEAYNRMAQVYLLMREIAKARACLEEMGKLPDLTEEQKILLSLKIAGTYGAEDNWQEMEKIIKGVEKENKQLLTAQLIETFWKAGQFFMNSRDYPVVEAFLKRANWFRASSLKEYLCRFVPQAPVGVGGWVQSELVKDKKNREARFYNYDIKSAALLLATDVSAQRPFPEEPTKEKRGETAFYMCYDRQGWHIYVQSDEPRIEQITLENGRGASSLEMFFMPGENKEYYYQWIIKLATGEVNVYNYHSPHRYFHPLENTPGNFQTQTAVIPTGWGTTIFIPWECFYDCLPFLSGNETTWRFSMQRWDPAGNITWGGRVHETGRWGLIRWEIPPEQEKQNILRYLIRKAWYKYQASRDAAVDYWSCSERGDKEFYQHYLQPEITRLDLSGQQLTEIDTWPGEKLESFLKEIVPKWMEFTYQIEGLRKEYLSKKHFSGK